MSWVWNDKEVGVGPFLNHLSFAQSFRGHLEAHGRPTAKLKLFLKQNYAKVPAYHKLLKISYIWAYFAWTRLLPSQSYFLEYKEDWGFAPVPFM